MRLKIPRQSVLSGFLANDLLFGTKFPSLSAFYVGGLYFARFLIMEPTGLGIHGTPVIPVTLAFLAKGAKDTKGIRGNRRNRNNRNNRRNRRV